MLFQNSFRQNPFSQKSLTRKERQPHTLPQRDLVQQNQRICCCYYKPLRSGGTEKGTKILKNGTRDNMSLPSKNESPDLSNALWFISLIRVAVEINNLNFPIFLMPRSIRVNPNRPGRFLKFSKNFAKKISIINISTTTRTRGTSYSAFERPDIGLSFWSGELLSPRAPSFRILVSFSGIAASRQFRTL